MSKAFAGMVTKLQEAYQKLNKSNRELTATSKSFQEKMAEMEEFNKMMVGREIKMLELKKEIENLKKIKN
jgi:predicted  nucleic acid-binding Zn-ribbon protein